MNLTGAMICIVLGAAAVGAGAQTRPATDAQGPREALAAEIVAARAGDVGAVGALLFAGTDQRHLIGPVAEVAVAQARYERAMRDHFGAAAAGRYGVATEDHAAQAAAARETIDGDRAELVLGNGAAERRITLVKSDGAWRIPLAAIVNPIENAAPHEIGGRYVDVAKALDEVTADIRSGVFPTADAAAAMARRRADEAASGHDAQ